VPTLRSNSATSATRKFVAQLPRHALLELAPGARTYGLVLGSTREDTTVIDLASEAIVRWRIPWAAGADTDLALFDVVEGRLADDLERDDLAQPEAVTLAALPRQIGTYRSRRVRSMLAHLQTPSDGPLFGFRGPSAPYWEFRGERPSVALIVADRGPQLLRRFEDNSTWVRFGWDRDDVWLLCEDPQANRALDAARRHTLSGKDLAVALGYRPTYVLTTLSRPIAGHCYKICTGLLPRG
jgi:hypothetical protein